MRRLLLVLLATVSAACSPGRDPQFIRIVQFSAVDKLQLADAWVYFAEGDGLKRVEKAAKTPMVETLLASTVTDFAVVPEHIYVATPSGVVHLPITTMGVGQAASLSNDNALAIAADKAGVSWVTCTSLTHAAPDGSAQVTVPVAGMCAGAATQLVLDSSTAYGVSGRGEWYASRSGGSVTWFANEPCKHIAAAGGWLYCANEAAGLTRFSPIRPEVEQVLNGNVRAFAVGEARIYAGVGADLISSPRNSTQVDVLGTLAQISSIAVDAANVFFVNTEGNLGLLLRTAQ
ncbi:MAG: hypothetical protein JNK82_03745 [Myxococcaceae bacterium]|nr:hypothetical protein [Myxococcaceae bacterium]